MSNISKTSQNLLLRYMGGNGWNVARASLCWLRSDP